MKPAPILAEEAPLPHGYASWKARRFHRSSAGPDAGARSSAIQTSCCLTCRNELRLPQSIEVAGLQAFVAREGRVDRVHERPRALCKQPALRVDQVDCGGGERVFGEQGLDPTGAKILFEHPDGCEADAQTLTHSGHDCIVIVETVGLDIPPGLQVHFDIRVLTAFRKQLSDEINRGLHRLQNLNAANADKDLGTALESIYRFGPMRSFRDIENQVEITSLDSKSAHVLNALGR